MERGQKSFWKALSIYIQKPHVINRKICGFRMKKILRLSPSADVRNLSYIVKEILDDSASNIEAKMDCVMSIFSERNVTYEEKDNLESLTNILSSLPFDIHVIIRTVIPKYIEGEHSLLEVVFLDMINGSVVFVAQLSRCRIKSLPELPHAISYSKEDGIKLEILSEEKNSSCENWLKRALLPRLLKWSLLKEENVTFNTTDSLRLVDLQEYNTLYQELKSKYAQQFISMWTESTDPNKFVHEDVGIAAYLLLLWKRERIRERIEKKQTFLDMGCGNGLLVYILTQEGHEGVGVDIKSRKIWDAYPKEVILKEESITPSCDQLFPEYDWLIGNHSDELTPWIPVISSKSGWHSRFLVLPCCPFDFYSKFHRQKSGMSQYNEYLSYIEEISKVCGFNVERDKLRIPSTKRVCLIGEKRTYTIENRNLILNNIDELLNERKASLKKHSSFDKQETIQFKVREKIQEVKNCTQIKQEIKDELIEKVAKLLLKQFNRVYFEKKSLSWNSGGLKSLKEVAESFTPLQLRHLKSECGGLQTLLKNHRHVFLVKNGSVQIRVPQPVSDLNVPQELLRTKSCWFFKRHPNGCPLDESECPYQHPNR